MYRLNSRSVLNWRTKRKKVVAKAKQLFHSKPRQTMTLKAIIEFHCAALKGPLYIGTIWKHNSCRQ